MYIEYNPNPMGKNTGDCVIRAIAKALDLSWDDAFFAVMSESFMMKDMPSSNAVWGALLKNNGFKRYVIPDYCPNCYTIRDFCDDNFYGTYVVTTGSHAVAVKNGDYFDSWDSGGETVVYYWRKTK